MTKVKRAGLSVRYRFEKINNPYAPIQNKTPTTRQPTAFCRVLSFGHVFKILKFTKQIGPFSTNWLLEISWSVCRFRVVQVYALLPFKSAFESEFILGLRLFNKKIEAHHTTFSDLLHTHIGYF